MSYVLVVSRHGKKFSRGQIDLLEKVHGKRSIITFEPRRFSSKEELLDFHKETIKNYDFIYYTLPVAMKSFLKKEGYNFSVILAPRKNRRAIELAIVHHVAEQEDEVVKVEKRIPRKRGAKSYRNTPRIPLRKTG